MDIIVKLKDVILEETKYYVIMELADGGDLKQLIDKRNGLLMPEDEILKIFYQMVLAVQVLH